jgi:ABC-2 type transport system permease protein
VRAILTNPVLIKEFKLRFRSFKGFLGLLLYLLALTVLIIGFIFLQTQNSPTGIFRPDQSKEMFMVMSYIQLVLILFITPGLTAGVISSEREKQTLNILLTTNQSSTSIVIGKLVSSVSYLLLMIVASLPIYSIVFLFGGISPSQVLIIFGFFVFTILAYGSIGVLLSTLVRKTIISMISTYGITLFLAGGTAFFFAVFMSVNQMGITANNPVPYFFAMFNPFMVLMAFLEPDALTEISRMIGIDFPIWAAYIILYTLIFISAIVISIRKLRPNMKVKK